MRRLLLALVVTLAPMSAFSGQAFAQTAPRYNLGFMTLARLIPDVVGDPLESEHYAANGDSIQHTSKGMMVWRKADNWTAFTNGYWTWINGPNGLQDRANTDRFDWESATPASAPAPAPTVTPQSAPQPATAMPTNPVPFKMTASKVTVGEIVQRKIEFTNTDPYWRIEISESAEGRVFPYGRVQLPFELPKTSLGPGESFTWTDTMSVAEYGQLYGTTLIWSSVVRFRWVSPDGKTGTAGTLPKSVMWHRVQGY